MTDRRNIDELKQLGSGRPAPEPIAALYRQAFQKFGVQCLWSRRPSAQPTIAQALVVAECLRREGNLESRALAARIEGSCRAVV